MAPNLPAGEAQADRPGTRQRVLFATPEMADFVKVGGSARCPRRFPARFAASSTRASSSRATRRCWPAPATSRWWPPFRGLPRCRPATSPGCTGTIEDGITGFLFREFSLDALLGATRRAFAAFERRGRLEAMRRAAMTRPVGWRDAALAYRGVYSEL